MKRGGIAVYWGDEGNGCYGEKKRMLNVEDQDDIVVDEDEIHGDIEEGEIPNVHKSPVGQSQHERERHEAIHIPYREWCEDRVNRKATDSQHTVNSGKEGYRFPTIAMDYMYMGARGENLYQYWWRR